MLAKPAIRYVFVSWGAAMLLVAVYIVEELEMSPYDRSLTLPIDAWLVGAASNEYRQASIPKSESL